MRIAIITILVLKAALCMADTYVRQPALDALHYGIALELTEESEMISAVAGIDVMVRGRATGMWLDFGSMAVDALTVNGAPRSFVHRDGRLAFDFGKTCGPNEIVRVEVKYHGRPTEGLQIGRNRHGRRVGFADNWPDKARGWFPSIDHPSDKATVSFKITAPAKYDIVANGRLAATESLPDGRRRTEWVESRSIPTYCMVFGMAEFSISYREGPNRLPMVWYSYPQDAEAAAAKFRRTSLFVSAFEKLIAPYPYEKLAQVEASIRYGGMENAGTIFYSESGFLGEPVSEEPVAHEIAHQWFGNSVTAGDWDHLWLSEGFATYMEALLSEQLSGPAALREIMARHAEMIFEYPPARSAPVVDGSVKEAGMKLNPLNYEKGAWVLHMLRGLLGEARFFKGLREFYARYEGRSALTGDFQKVMEETSGMDLSRFFRQWLYEPGWPEISAEWRWIESGELELVLRQEQPANLFEIQIEVEITMEGDREIRKLAFADRETVFRIALPAAPSAVEIDPYHRLLRNVTSIRREDARH